jgi:hypothetical protein
MSAFYDTFAPLAQIGIPLTPVRPGTKAAFLPDFPTTATTDLEQIKAWDILYPNHNAACVARAEVGGVWMLEVDSPAVLERIKTETGHDLIQEVSTFRVRSRPGRGHFYFKQNAASMAMGNIAQTYVKGQDWSARVNREYCVAAGSLHPETGQPYTAMGFTAPTEAPQWLVDWLLSQKIQKATASGGDNAPRNERGLVPHGAIHNWMLAQAGKLRQMGLDQPEIEVALLKLVHDNCEPPIDDSKVVQMSKSICNFPPGEGNKSLWMNQTFASPIQAPPAQEDGNTILDPAILEDEIQKTEAIPQFDRSVINGIFRDYVELVTKNTTMEPQFAFLATRVIIGALVTARGIAFQDADTDGLIYGATIGESGSGKGWAWRRVLRAFELGAKAVGSLHGFGAKVMNGIDSGAGLKDFFFTDPENQPIIAYIDEVADLGEKADPKRNPGIVTALIELAENRSVSRTLAGKKRHKNDAFLASYLAGQHGEVYMMSLPNRSRLGLFDRMRPEYSIPVAPGRTPEIDIVKAGDLYRRLMTMLGQIRSLKLNADGEDLLEMFWVSQPADVQVKVRFKKHILVDAFLSAFARGSSTVEVEDVERATRIFERELVIRKVHFQKEVPNRIAIYTDKFLELTERMRRQLNRGAHRDIVALGRSDFEKACNVYNTGDYDQFERAWQMFSRANLERWNKVNRGKTYEKYLPKPREDGGALGW